eukprot:1357011-Rhodomonas_salina.2
MHVQVAQVQARQGRARDQTLERHEGGAALRAQVEVSECGQRADRFKERVGRVVKGGPGKVQHCQSAARARENPS